jgi:hypothetical protein
MPNLQFGTGVLYGFPSGGNLPTNPTPIRLLLQEVSIDFKGDLKKLYTQSQFPLATARGKIDVTGKAKIVDYDPDPINQLFWAQNIATGMTVFVDQELDTIPTASPFTVTVTNAATFDVDNGVTYTTGTNAGQVLLNVSPAAPATTQYSVNTTTGVYTFAAVDNTRGVAISYTYVNSTRGKTITLTSELMGYAPTCRMDFWNNFRSKMIGIRLNSATLGSWSYPSKLEDFWVSDVAFDANLDSGGNLGKIFSDVY